MGNDGGKLGDLKTEVEIAKLRAEASKIAGEVPSLPDVKTPEGTVDATKADGLIGRMIVYRMLETEAAEIVRLIGSNLCAPSRGDAGAPPIRVLLVSSPDLLGTDLTYTTVRGGIARQTETVEECLASLEPFLAPPAEEPLAPFAPEGELPPAGGMADMMIAGIAAPGLALGGAALQAAADLVGVFRVDYTVTGSAVALDQKPLLAAIAREIRGKGWRVVIDGFRLAGEGGPIADFDVLRGKGEDLVRSVALLRARYPIPADGDGADRDETSLRAHGLLAGAEAALKNLAEFATQVTATPAGGGSAPLLVAAQGALLHEEGDSPITHVVYAGVEGGGQETITRRGFWWFTNRKVHYLGGAAAYHFVYDVERAEVVAAGTRPLVGKLRFDLGKATVEQKLESLDLG